MRSKLAALLTLSVMTLCAVSCASVDGSEKATIDRAVCASWPTIYGSWADTDYTLRQVFASNLAREQFCRPD